DDLEPDPDEIRHRLHARRPVRRHAPRAFHHLHTAHPTSPRRSTGRGTGGSPGPAAGDAAPALEGLDRGGRGAFCMLSAVGGTREELGDGNGAAVLARRVAPGQEQFVSSVRESLAEAAEFPQARPWYRAVVADGTLVGFVMVSWDAEPQPPEIIGPWFLWKLLIDERYQGRGYGAEVVRQVAELVRAQGANELLTSYVPQAGCPA